MTDDPTPKRSTAMAAVLEPLMEPGDVVLVVGKDDSCTQLFGQDYRDAYAQGTLTPGMALPSVFLGMKILGEYLTGQIRLCLPGEPADAMSLQLTKEKLAAFKVAKAEGTLAPRDTIYLVAGAYQQLAVVLEGHMAACLPNEYRKLQEQARSAPSQRLWKSADPSDPKPS